MNAKIDWAKIEYSKSKINDAVKKILKLDENETINSSNKENGYKVIANWRNSHEYPMQSIINYFRKKAFEVDKKAIVVRRLKRIPSIISKLKRFPNMKITTMGDIGGIRIITKNKKNVLAIRDKIKKGRTKNKLLNEKDYLENPKESGYRSIHLMYSYQGEKEEYKNYRIELQIRSEIQHAWATAVEVVDVFTNQNLKDSKGHQNWNNFFKKTSIVLEKLEKNEDQMPEHINYIQKEQTRLIKKIQSFSIVANSVNKDKESYYLLHIYLELNKIRVEPFNNDFLGVAMQRYLTLESDIKDNKSEDVVLVSAKSVKELKKAYPNYFSDTKMFINYLNKAIN